MNLDGFFKFKIGDVVTHLVTANVTYDKYAREDARMCITGRHLSEHAGGVTKRYQCTSVARRGRIEETSLTLYEIELVRSVPFGPEKPAEEDR